MAMIDAPLYEHRRLCDGTWFMAVPDDGIDRFEACRRCVFNIRPSLCSQFFCCEGRKDKIRVHFIELYK